MDMKRYISVNLIKTEILIYKCEYDIYYMAKLKLKYQFISAIVKLKQRYWFILVPSLNQKGDISL